MVKKKYELNGYDSFDDFAPNESKHISLKGNTLGALYAIRMVNNLLENETADGLFITALVYFDEQNGLNLPVGYYTIDMNDGLPEHENQVALSTGHTWYSIHDGKDCGWYDCLTIAKTCSEVVIDIINLNKKIYPIKEELLKPLDDYNKDTTD